MRDQLWEIFEENDLGRIYEKTDVVKALTRAVAPTKQIRWEKIRHLYIYENANLMTELELPHVSHDDSWLLIPRRHIPTAELEDVLHRCGNHLLFLRLESARYSPGQKVLDLSEMQQLRFLQIKAGLGMRIAGLEQLADLRILRLEGLFDLPVLNLARMKGLQVLDIGRNDHLAVVEGLDSLTELKRLTFWEMDRIRELDFSRSKQLELLHLSDVSELIKIPALHQLHRLEQLVLFNTPKLDLSVVDVSGMRDLHTLWISDNDSLRQIDGLEKTEHLKELNISYTGIRRIPDGLRGKPLEALDLSGLELEELPDWLPELGLAFSLDLWGDGICLYNTTVKGVDMSIFQQPREVILQWFEERKKKNEVLLNEIKVVFLGDGEAGKSHTIARLLNDGGAPKDYTDQSTPGIVIKNKDYPMDGRNIRVHYWDFGGQEILHSMHRIFLTERTLYVVLVNARDETQDARARYWLHNIQSFAKNAPVILVLNKIDQNPKAKVNEPDLRSRYANLRQVIPLSALKFEQEEFNRVFTDVLLDEIRQTGFPDVKWPVPWTKVKGELEQMPTNYISGARYREICRDCSVDRNEKNLLNWFNDLGVSFSCCDDYRLENYVILRPDWITNALYIILFNDCPGAKNGLIPHQSIFGLLKEDPENAEKIRRVRSDVFYTWDEIRYVLEVFHKSQLSFDAGNQKEFIPMLCDPESAPAAQEYAQDENTLEFCMEFDYLPNNLLHQLMVDRKDELRMDQVWRTGGLFRQPETGFSAVVAIDEDTLRFFIRSADPMHRPNTYLAMLKANVDRIRKKMGLKEPKNWLVYKTNGERVRFGYERLLKMYARGRKEEYCEDLDRDFRIEDILNQSAPDGLEEQGKLLEGIIRSCLNIQGDMRYIGSDEDDRNNRMRDDLRLSGYTVNDQTRQGSSGSGRNPGELDLAVYSENGSLWTIIEALRIRDGSKADWNSHLDKLLGNYNAHGLPFLFLVTYVDDDDGRFKRIWNGYRDHIPSHGTEAFTCVPGSFEVFDRPLWKDKEFICTAKCRYDCGGYTATVYHIFLRIGR